MNFFVKMCRKRSDATCHYVDNRVRNMIFLDMFATRFQCSNVIIDSLCGSNLRDINFEAVGIVKFKLVIIDLCHALKLALIHATVTVGFAGNMIFNVFFILVILRELVDKGLIPSVSPQ